MTTTENTSIAVAVTINAPVEKVWELLNDPRHITKWNSASDDWHTTSAENDLRVGGKLRSRMEARDGSAGFDFEGTYDEIITHERIVYTMSDGRKVQITFAPAGNKTTITETFDAEGTNSVEMQRAGWQAILNNFKRYVESKGELEKLHFEIDIQAPALEVHKTMLDREGYTTWTSEFNPTSHYEGSWEKGSKMLFIGTDENGVKGGMVARIAENIPGKFVSIEHLGIIAEGKEITSGPEVEGWAGARENYTLTETKGKTRVSVDVDSNSEFKAYFSEAWPRALKKLKEICEG